VISFWRRARRGDNVEEKKIIIDRSFRLAMIRCSIHFLPIAATIALASLNLKGFFVGGEYLGLSGPTALAVDTLLPQITSKLMVNLLGALD
jgi:hypothetical protein